MPVQSPFREPLMRFMPAALALSLFAAVTASGALSAPPSPLSPRAQELVRQGQAELTAGNSDGAFDAFEAALAVQPGSPQIYILLAEASRRNGMQGKALRYYREALANDPQNLAAISGEGAALVEKGAVDRARRTLTRLKALCGEGCEPPGQLSAAIARGPAPGVITAEAVTSEPVVSDN